MITPSLNIFQQAQVQNLMVQSGAAGHPTPHPSMNAHALTAFSVNGMVAPPTLPPQTTPGFPSSLPPPISAAAAANANLLSASLLPPHHLAAHMFGVRATAPSSVPSSMLPTAVSKEEHKRSTDHSTGKGIIEIHF